MKTDFSTRASSNLDSTENIRTQSVRVPAVKLLAVTAFLLGVLVTLTHRPWSQPEGGDEAIWDYVAQCIVRGQVPYKDVVEIKSPLSAYMSAAAILIGRSAGVRDVIAIRIQNVLLVGLLSTLTFLVAVKYLRNITAACIGVLIQLTPSHFGDWMVAGTEPKLPMLIFGLATLMCIAKRKPFWAGFFSMLACLSWQPGLMFTGVALLVFSKYMTSWRDGAALRALLGALLPLMAFLTYFYVIGAAIDLWIWTVAYNLEMYAPETAKGFVDAVGLLFRVLLRVFRIELIFVAFGVAGLVLFALQRIRAEGRAGTRLNSQELFKDALVIVPLIYLAFCLINFQSGPDLIPLFPFIGMFAGWLIANLSDRMHGRQREKRLGLVVIAALLVLLAVRLITYKIESGLTLQAQEQAFEPIARILSPGDGVYAHGTVELLVLLNRPNINPHVDLRKGKDAFIDQRTPGGFQAFINEMESAPPKIVAISRDGRLIHRGELRQWVEEHYDQMYVPGYEGIYLRRPQ